jgi:hypothetical protein
VGPSGLVVGIDTTPEMLDKSRETKATPWAWSRRVP